MTFDEFRAARVKVDDVSIEGRWSDGAPEGEMELSRAGWIYPTGLFIVDVGQDWPADAQREGAHNLILGNQEWLTDDLGALERILYDAHDFELADEDPDDLVSGNARARTTATTHGLVVNHRIAAAKLR